MCLREYVEKHDIDDRTVDFITKSLIINLEIIAEGKSIKKKM